MTLFQTIHYNIDQNMALTKTKITENSTINFNKIWIIGRNAPPHPYCAECPSPRKKKNKKKI